MEREYQICKSCVMDTSDEDITFDENGVCMRCNEYKDRILPEWNHGRGHEKELKSLISQIKKSGKGKQYDCILGLSGGLDSSYLLHLAVKEWGLRPFVFHIDAGWDLPVATENIRRLAEKLNVHVHVETIPHRHIENLIYSSGVICMNFITESFKGRTLVITGGTGSFGSTVLKHFLPSELGEIRIISRDEKKQDTMRHMLQARYPEYAAKVKFFVGDVRDLDSVRDSQM